VGLGVGASLGLGESRLGLQLFFEVEVELRVVGETVEDRFERVTLPSVDAAGAGSDLLDDLEETLVLRVERGDAGLVACVLFQRFQAGRRACGEAIHGARQVGRPGAAHSPVRETAFTRGNGRQCRAA
jgi:hypothetical protein